MCERSFGYDTGQISGFLELPNFKERFGQRHKDGTYYFSDVRSGLIVALVSMSGIPTTSFPLMHPSFLSVHSLAPSSLLPSQTRLAVAYHCRFGVSLSLSALSSRYPPTMPGIKS